MLNLLIKKQVYSIGASMFSKSSISKKKTGTGGQKVLYALVFAYVIILFGYLFTNAFSMICPALVGAGVDSLYFTYVSIMALSLTIIFTMFMAKSQLFESKDNELLLALPIRPSYILVSRMAVFVAENVLIILYVFLIALFVYSRSAALSAKIVVCTLLTGVGLTLLATLISCIIGFIVARLTSGMRNKSLFTVIFTLVFLVAYFYGYSQLQNALAYLTDEAGNIYESIGIVNALGEACVGQVVKLVILLATMAVLSALMLWLLSANYIRIITTQKGMKRTAYKAEKLEASSSFTALVKRELLRFSKSSTYMLNTGLGILGAPVVAVFALIKGEAVRNALSSIDVFAQNAAALTGLVIVAIGFVNTMNNITAPSISIEGRTFWILRSLPLRAVDILKAKVAMALILTLPGTLFATVVVCAVMQVGVLQTLVAIIGTVAFVVFYELFGLNSNLKHYSLDWDNETYPIKQGFSCTVSIFGSWGIMLAVGGIDILFIELGLGAFSGLVVAVLFVVLAILAYSTLKRKGIQRFEQI